MPFFFETFPALPPQPPGIGAYLSHDRPLLSRDQAKVTVVGGVALPSGTVLGRITGTGALVKRNTSATDGSQVPACVLFTPLPAVNGTYNAVVHARSCVVTRAALNGGSGIDDTGAAALEALKILVR